jgi:hypothetical protein
MKNIIFTTLIILTLFTALSFGQARNTNKPQKCCCEHTQQIAEDLHFFRNEYSKLKEMIPNSLHFKEVQKNNVEHKQIDQKNLQKSIENIITDFQK